MTLKQQCVAMVTRISNKTTNNIALFLDFYRDLDIEVSFVDVGLSLNNTSFVMSIKSQKTLCK